MVLSGLPGRIAGQRVPLGRRAVGKTQPEATFRIQLERTACKNLVCNFGQLYRPTASQTYTPFSQLSAVDDLDARGLGGACLCSVIYKYDIGENV